MPDLTRIVPRLALSAAVCASACVAGCAAPPTRPGRASAGPGPVRLEPSEAQAALVEAHNRPRLRAGLPPLAVNDALSLAAQRHADEMAARRRMAHRGVDGSSPFRRMRQAGYAYSRAGENVAAGQATVAEVMAGWMASPGHRRNILGKFTEVGTGYAIDAAGTPYWCVTFGTPAGTGNPAGGPGVGYPFGR
jgi:uncharacterized protein YkwD